VTTNGRPPDSGTTLMVASTGGHLAQLRQLSSRLRGVSEQRVWITFDTVQSRSLLADPDVVFVRRTHSRDIVPAVANIGTLDRLLKEHEVTSVVSTGSAVALSAMLPARRRRIPCHYIESAARSAGPSLTGKMLRAVPGVKLYTQYRNWEDGHWRYRGSVFDGFRAGSTNGHEDARRIVVTLGTGRYGFRRLVERLLDLLPPRAEVLWQTGPTDTSGLPIDPTPDLPYPELMAAMKQADLVVSHAGVGSALGALEAGRMPILVPRRPEYGEIVDRHQQQAAHELEERGLALMREADALTREDLQRATGSTVEPAPAPSEIELDQG
jgi:UDP-N-acetylglucosamine--N-acetylmuramyl-(pentapeptide) pyrophosphoryl-undecaprenol N-acetylglucosamine transferase